MLPRLVGIEDYNMWRYQSDGEGHQVNFVHIAWVSELRDVEGEKDWCHLIFLRFVTFPFQEVLMENIESGRAKI